MINIIVFGKVPRTKYNGLTKSSPNVVKQKGGRSILSW